jgi:NAD(P)H-dependent flavin oxidoreductase YrpB (nitropropane dioxygenase family)
MLETAFTRLVGCAAPIQVAPMGAISTPSLIAAASRAGALGMVGTAGMRAEQVTPMLDAVLGLARGPVGANMLMPFADKAIIEITAPRVRVFDFYHGAPDPSLVAIVHRAGARRAGRSDRSRRPGPPSTPDVTCWPSGASRAAAGCTRTSRCGRCSTRYSTL